MDLGMIGLGRMGKNLVRRLRRDGHRAVVYDVDSASVEALVAEGADGAKSLADLAGQLSAPRAVWVMVPAGIAGKVIEEVAAHLEPGDIIIDGGNSFYQDDLVRSAALSERGIRLLDVGTSGGVFGLERGFCLMIGGEAEAVQQLDPIFRSLAPGIDAAERTAGRSGEPHNGEYGYLYCGPSGAGHFVKMVHNGIEYGMMQAFAEGFEMLDAKEEMGLDLQQIAEIWQHGSVVRSWLLDLIADAFAVDQGLSSLSDYVDDSGEGRWTVQDSIDLAVPTPVLTLALQMRFRSRQSPSFGGKVLNAMRAGFGGHAIKPAE